MIIRNCLPGDAEHEAAIYNAAASRLPGFTPTTADEVRRANGGLAFEPGTRFYAEEGGRVVGFASFDLTGRIQFPWCRPGHEKMAHQLIASVLRGLAERRITRAYAACRVDWADPVEFFEDHGFEKVRDVVNFTQSIGDLPTMFQRPGLNVSLIAPEDVPAIGDLVPWFTRLRGTALVNHLLHNRNLPADAVYVLRRKDGTPQGVGLLIDDAAFAAVETLDPKAAVFRFGAFGFEGLPAKRVNGLFSFLAAPGKDSQLIGQDLLWYGTSRMATNTFDHLAAQVPSDAPHLLHFYERYFQKEGSFPVFEREVGSASRF